MSGHAVKHSPYLAGERAQGFVGSEAQVFRMLAHPGFLGNDLGFAHDAVHAVDCVQGGNFRVCLADQPFALRSRRKYG